MPEAISRCMGKIHIVDKSDTLLLVPCRTVRVIIINWNLSGVICHGYRQLTARVICTQQDIRHSLRSRFRWVPGFYDGIQILVCCVTGDWSSIKMNPNQRLTTCSGSLNKCILTFRQIDVGSVHTFAHGRHRACAVLSSQSQDHSICFPDCLQRFFKSALILSGNRIPVCIQNLRVCHPLLQFF